MKTCTRCEASKSLNEYHRDKTKKDGRCSKCKRCISELRAEFNARPDVRARDKQYRSKPEVKLAKAEYRAQYYARPEVAKRRADYYETNREHFIESMSIYRMKNYDRLAEYNKANPHRQWESLYRRRAIRYGVTPTISAFTKEDLTERYGDACVECGGEWEHLDHVIPVRFGGEHSLDNCQPVCRPCNLARWHRYQSEAYDLMFNIYTGEAA